MKLRWIVSALFFLPGCALQAAAQDDDYGRCVEHPESNPDLALQYCTTAIQSGNLSQERLARARKNRGIAFYTKGERDRAIEDFNEAIRLKPDLAEAFYDRAIAFDDKGESDRAIQDYGQAIRLRPDFSEAFKNRGTSFIYKGQYDRAIEDFDHAIRLKPDDFKAFRDRGVLFTIKEMYDRAAQDFDEAIRLKPDFGPSFLDRGLVRFIRGQFDAAQQDFATMLQLAPTSSYAGIWLYLATAKQGKDATSELLKVAPRFDSTVWPAQVLNLYLDKTTMEWVLYTAKDQDQKTDREHHCQAYFFLGEYALLADKQEDAKHLFEQSVKTGVTYFIEYSAAQMELKRLALQKYKSKVTQRSPSASCNEKEWSLLAARRLPKGIVAN